MKDSEFYRLEENWPQPPDDPCTLEEVRQGSGGTKKGKKFSSAKIKKKMSESLAGVTAAAVAVVMVASAIPSLKDAFDDLPDFPEFFEPSEICTVCGREDCPYYYDGALGIRVSFEYNEPAYIGDDDLYAMPGFMNDTVKHADGQGCVFTADDQRLILHLGDIYSELEFQSSHGISNNNYLAIPDQPAYTGEIYEIIDEKAGESYFFMAVLMYAPDGNIPVWDGDDIHEEFPYLDVNPAGLVYRSVTIQEVKNAKMLFYSNLDSEQVDALTDNFSVSILNGRQMQYELGQTLYFNENEEFCRSYWDTERGACSYLSNYDEKTGMHTRFYSYGFHNKLYTVTSYNMDSRYDICFAQVSWNDIFDKWDALNDDAIHYGHEVHYPVQLLDTVTVNAIAYRVYIMYSSEPEDVDSEYYRVNLYYVPQQEANIVIEESCRMTLEEIRLLQEDWYNVTNFEAEEFLQQITLR